MKRTIAAALLALSLGLGGTVAAQSGAKEEAKKAGEATKDAGKATGEAAKHAGKATVKATKKAGSEVKKVLTGDAHATCVDGTRTEAKTEEAAAALCSRHGGVAKK